MSATLYGFGGTVKAMGQGRIAGFGIPFYEPDCVKDVFTPQTKLGLEDRLAVPILYSHGHDPYVRDEELGKIRQWETRNEGVWIEGQLDLTVPHASDVYELALAGELGWSSACVGHLTHRMAQPDGTNLLLKWIVAEWSLTTQACSLETPAVAAKNFKHVSLREALRWHKLTEGQRLRERGERLLRKIQGRGPTIHELRETSLYFQARVAQLLGHDWTEAQRAEAQQYRQQRAKEHACTCHSKPKSEPQVITKPKAEPKIVTVDRAQLRRDYHSELRMKYAGHVFADLEIRKALERFDQSHAAQTTR